MDLVVVTIVFAAEQSEEAEALAEDLRDKLEDAVVEVRTLVLPEQ